MISISPTKRDSSLINVHANGLILRVYFAGNFKNLFTIVAAKNLKIWHLYFLLEYLYPLYRSHVSLSLFCRICFQDTLELEKQCHETNYFWYFMVGLSCKKTKTNKQNYLGIKLLFFAL